MRIIGTIDHPTWKITLFKMDNKFSIKFEDRFLEQTYKFREGEQLSDEAALRQLVDDHFLQSVQREFESMQRVHQQVLDNHPINAGNADFPEII